MGASGAAEKPGPRSGPLVTLDIAHLPIPGVLTASGLQLALDLSTATPTLRARAGSLTGAALHLRDLTLDCPLALPRLECLDGRLEARLADGTVLRARVAFRHTPSGSSARISDLTPGGDTWGLDLNTTAGASWTVRFAGSGLDLAGLHRHLPERWIQHLGARWPATATGQLDLDAVLSGQGHGVQRVEATAVTRAWGFTALDAAEGAGTRTHLLARQTDGSWWFQAEARHDAGLLFLVPGLPVAGGLPGLLLDAGHAGATTLHARGSWRPAEARLHIDALRLAQGDWLAAEARLEVSDGQLHSLGLTLAATPFAPLYRGWLQPFLAGSPLDSLEGEGQIALHFAHGPSGEDLRLDLDGLTLRDGRARFALAGLSGRIVSGARHAGEVHRLSFTGLNLHGLPLGPARLLLAAGADGLTLQEPVEIPLLDGHFVVDGLSLRRPETAPGAARINPPELRLSGVLTPVTLAALSDTLGLPRAAGQFSGVLPEVLWSAAGIRIDGDLLLRIFDGRIVARDLRVLDPFGTLPELATDLDIEQIDLDLLTREAPFGRIQGRIGGQVRGLRLQAWQPVAMDLHLATPENNDRPRRISQQAVDSLAALSGGGAGLLSRGLMRFFSEYSYGRLGVGCRLVNGVCTVSGVERPADRGVVLVSRGGLLPPWIEVRASSREISWRSLVEIYRRIERGELMVR